MGRIKAVLVGINVYANPEVPPLHGCANDVALVRRILKQYFRVPNDDIRVLVNERATKANIMHRLERLVYEAEAGDTLVFYFSGHGSQIRDRSGDELVDWMDEILCPADMDWDRGTYILDDDLDALFAELPDEVLLEAFFDCCFWGASRFWAPPPSELEPEPRPQRLRADVRYLPPPLDIMARVEGEEEWVQHHHFQGCECFSARNVLWAASEEGQPAAEDYFDGRVQGVFTYWGCEFLEQRLAGRHAYSRFQLLDDLRGYMRSLGYTQTPELAAPDDLLVSPPFLPAPAGRWEPAWTRRTHRV